MCVCVCVNAELISARGVHTSPRPQIQPSPVQGQCLHLSDSAGSYFLILLLFYFLSVREGGEWSYFGDRTFMLYAVKMKTSLPCQLVSRADNKYKRMNSSERVRIVSAENSSMFPKPFAETLRKDGELAYILCPSHLDRVSPTQKSVVIEV